MKILVIGSSGLVGSRFAELYPRPKDLLAPSHEQLDITDRSSVANYFAASTAEVIVNFSAYTNVGEAEKQRDDKTGECWRLNVAGVANLLSALGDKFLVQISTDMVFSGSEQDPGPYSEDHLPQTDNQKITWYGYTKAEAERLVEGRGTVLRLIYPVRAKFAGKLDYLRKPLQLYNQGKLYPLFTDQQVSVTFIDAAYQAIRKIIDSRIRGTFHASSRDTTNPYELICYLLGKLGKDPSGVQKSSIASVSNPVRYPKFGGLKVEVTEKRLGIKFSTWKEVVDKLVEQGITA